MHMQVPIHVGTTGRTASPTSDENAKYLALVAASLANLHALARANTHTQEKEQGRGGGSVHM